MLIPCLAHPMLSDYELLSPLLLHLHIPTCVLHISMGLELY